MHPVAFALGFLLHALDGLVQHTDFVSTPFAHLNPFIDLLLQHWGVTVDDINQARDLVKKYLDDPSQKWGSAYKEAALKFARSSPERSRMWLAHIYAVIVFQSVLTTGKVSDKSSLFVYHQGKILGLSDEEIEKIAAQGANIGVIGALIVRGAF